MHFVFYTQSSTNWQSKLRWLFTGLEWIYNKVLKCELWPSSRPYQQNAPTGLRQALALAMCKQHNLVSCRCVIMSGYSSRELAVSWASTDTKLATNGMRSLILFTCSLTAMRSQGQGFKTRTSASQPPSPVKRKRKSVASDMFVCVATAFCTLKCPRVSANEDKWKSWCITKKSQILYEILRCCSYVEDLRKQTGKNTYYSKSSSLLLHGSCRSLWAANILSETSCHSIRKT